MVELYMIKIMVAAIAFICVDCYIIYEAVLWIFDLKHKAAPQDAPGLPIGTHGKFTDADTDDIDLDDQISRFRFTSK